MYVSWRCLLFLARNYWHYSHYIALCLSIHLRRIQPQISRHIRESEPGICTIIDDLWVNGTAAAFGIMSTPPMILRVLCYTISTGLERPVNSRGDRWSIIHPVVYVMIDSDYRWSAWHPKTYQYQYLVGNEDGVKAHDHPELSILFAVSAVIKLYAKPPWKYLSKDCSRWADHTETLSMARLLMTSLGYLESSHSILERCTANPEPERGILVLWSASALSSSLMKWPVFVRYSI